MGDEQRPPRRPSIAVTQSGNPDKFPYLSSESSSTGAISFAGDPRLRVPSENPSNWSGSTAKVAIPRASNISESSINKRVGHACEPCREQKTKCSGDRPACQRCQDLGLSCFYGDRKRERTAKSLTQIPAFISLFFVNLLWLTYYTCLHRQLKDLAKQVQEYEQLLNDLHPRLSPEDAQLIQETLSRVGCRMLSVLALPSLPSSPFLFGLTMLPPQQQPNVDSVV